MAFALARHFALARARARFEVGTVESRRRLEERLRVCEDLLRGVRGLASSGPELDRDRFRAYLGAFDLQVRFPGLLGVTYGVPVPEEDRERLLAKLAREYPERRAAIHPGWGEGEACIAILGEPEGLNARAIGFNTFSAPDQRASLVAARDSGDLVASPPMKVAQAPESGPGLVLRLAVYRPGAPQDTSEARRRAFMGYGNAVFLLGDLAEGASARAGEDGLTLRLADITHPGKPVPFFAGGQGRPSSWWHLFGSRPMEERRTLRIGGRIWELHFTSGPGFLQGGEVGLPWLVGGAGLLIALLLGSLVDSIARTGERARMLATRMTDQLRRSESRLRAITQVMPDVILVLDDEGRYLEIHTGETFRLVAPESRLLGRTVPEVLPQAVSARVMATIRKALDQGGVHPCEYSVETPQGLLHFEARVAPMTREATERPCVIWVARDVTERRIQEEAQRQAQRLEGLGLLAGGIAHDFNNLLAAIQGYLSLERMDLEVGADPTQHLDRMEASIQRAADLARQLLAYSGRGTSQVEPLDLNRVVEEMSELLSVSRAKKVALDVQLAPGLPRILADRSQLQQVVMNLVTNAGEAIGEGTGTVTLRTGTCVLEAGEIERRLPGQGLAPGAFVQLCVQDDGSGIPPEVLTRIFDPFFTTKLTGRGLGLSAIRGILRAHRAGVEIHSIPGRGTTFLLYFPILADDPTGSGAPGPEATAAVPLSGAVLLADDEPTLRETSRTMVERLGLTVLEAADGQEAWDLFQAHREDLQWVILDLTMPRMGGLEVYQRIRAGHPSLPVLLCSGYSREAIPEPTDPSEPTAFLQKPFRYAQLTSALQELARKAAGEAG